MNSEAPREITTVREVRYQRPPPDPGIAAVLEVLPGILIQTFGIGNLYAGNVAAGILLMLGYWAATAVNFFLCFLAIGFLTWPLTWILFMIIAPIMANNAAKRRGCYS